MKCKRKNFAVKQKEKRLSRRELKREYTNRYKNRDMESINWFRARHLLPWHERIRIDKIQLDKIFGAQ